MRRQFLSVVAAALFGAVTPVGAQADCAAALQALWASASNACVTGPSGTICNGGAAPAAEPQGPVGLALAAHGALIEAREITALHTPPLQPETGSIGIAWVRMPEQTRATALLLGDVSLRDVTPAGFDVWTSSIVQTGAQPPQCAAAPLNTLVLQNTLGYTARLVINGASVGLSGTVLIRTTENTTQFIALSGLSTVTVFGTEQPLPTGHQLSVPYTPGDFTRPADLATRAVPFDPTALQNLPVALFPRPVILSQPGSARAGGVVNLRSAPATNAGIIMQVPAGEVMSVLGANPAGDWYHVRLDSGESGWILADLLISDTGPVTTVYEATPMPPQRFGELGNAGRVIAPAGASLRVGPDAGFPITATLSDGTLVSITARSPYSQWVKVESGGAVGWLPLITLDTQAYFDALPMDVSVPPPPTPTRIPGTFGNAFPDPRGGG